MYGANIEGLGVERLDCRGTGVSRWNGDREGV